jgi:hypothetical protein
MKRRQEDVRNECMNERKKESRIKTNKQKSKNYNESLDNPNNQNPYSKQSLKQVSLMSGYTT